MAKPQKPTGKLGRHYRLMWDINHNFESTFHPPMTSETVAMAQLGDFAGTPVDAYVGSIGPDAGYVTTFRSKKTQMEYLVDRYERGAALGSVQYWNHAENIKRSWAAGIDHLQIQIQEAHRLGVDPWFRISMNDWHHVDSAAGKVYRLGGSKFYEERPELLIGAEGAAGWADHPRLQQTMVWLQDFAHDEVRALRRDIAIETCERYDITGFLFDFMRVPGYFKYGEEHKNAHLITQMMRETRAGLDEVGRTRGRHIGLATRVPTTIEGTHRLGLEIEEWIADELIDVLVTTPFFAQDMEHDPASFVELGRDSSVSIIACIEEGYLCGHTDGHNRWFYQPPLMTGLSLPMVRGLAARHHARGVDGLYVFNWFGAVLGYEIDLNPALDDIASAERLRFKDKTFALTRASESFPNCLPTDQQIPVEVTTQPVELRVDVADDVAGAGQRVRAARLLLHLQNMSAIDTLEVKLNGKEVPVVNPIVAGTRTGPVRWQIFDLKGQLPKAGPNNVSVRARTRNARIAAELPMTIEDVEIEIRYEYPTGDVAEMPGVDRRVSKLGLPAW